MADIVEELFESDAASALTNRAAREIEALRAKVEKLEQERNAFQDQCIALRSRHANERAQLTEAQAKIEAAGKQDPVAFVEVSYEEPYHFHGLKLLGVGKHNLFTAPPITTAGECVWSPDSDEESDVWSGSCGAAWILLEGGPEENDMKFCPQCGKPVTTAPRGTEKEE